MSSVMGVVEAFVVLHDELLGRRPVTTELEAWPDHPEFESARAGWASAVDSSGMVAADLLSSVGSMSSEKLLGAVAALDHLISAANTDTASTDPVVSMLQERRQRYGCYLASPGGGAVLSKRVDQRQVQAGDETLADALGVVRVGARLWAAVDFVAVEATLDHAHVAGDALRIAAIPMGADLDDLEMTATTTAQGRHIYVAEPVSVLAARTPDAAKAICGADIGLAPELTLGDDILAAWKDALDIDDVPTFVFAGTGPVGNPTGASGLSCPGMSAPAGVGRTAAGEPLAPNRGVLLHGPTGRVIAAQDKRAGFTITSDLLDAYSLTAAPRESHDEGMEPGSKLTVIESRAGRFAMYICEDAGRTIDLAPHLVELGITHVLVPILATPMRTYRWQHTAGSSLAQRAGTTTMVFNSITLGRFWDPDEDTRAAGAPPVEEPANTLLVVEPEPGTYRPSTTWVPNDDAHAMSAQEDAITARVHTIQAR